MKAALKLNGGGSSAGSWQKSDGAFAFLIAMAYVIAAGTWVFSLPGALRGEDAAMEVALFSVGANALMVAALSAMFRKPLFLALGGLFTCLCLYVGSLFMSEVMAPQHVGMVMRVGAVAALAFGFCGWRLARRGAEMDDREVMHADD